MWHVYCIDAVCAEWNIYDYNYNKLFHRFHMGLGKKVSWLVVQVVVLVVFVFQAHH